MKKRIFWIALVAMLFMVKHSSYGQTLLEFKNNEAIIATNASHWRISTASIESLPQDIRVDCTIKEVQEIRSAHAMVGLDPNVFQWTTAPPGGGDINNDYVQLNQPGAYLFYIMKKSNGALWRLAITVSYISDPWVGVDVAATSSSPHLSSFGGTITAEKEVNLKLSNTFANPSYYKELGKIVNGTETSVAYGQIDYQITESGHYRLSTRTGSSVPIHNLDFEVVISSSTVTYTLTAIAGSGGTISPSGSVIVNQGGNQTFTATPDNGKMVDEWKVDGNVVASAGNTYTVSNVQANATVQVTFKDALDTSIHTIYSATTLSPNPTQSHLHISQTTTFPTHIEVYTLSAQRLLSKDFEGAEFDVDLSGCPAGVLVVKVFDGEQVGIYKVIKE
jgi:hypothetical protein